MRDGHRVTTRGAALQFFFLRCLFHAAPSCKGLRGGGLCTRKKESVYARESVREREITSPRYIIPRSRFCWLVDV